MSDYRQKVTSRLREVVEKHGGRTAFAKLIGKSPQTLTDYLSGKTLPGTRLRSAMRKAGVDEHYVMYGSTEEIEAEFSRNIGAKFRGLFPEKAAMLDTLEEHKIRTAGELQRILVAYHAMKSMVSDTDRPNQKGKKK